MPFVELPSGTLHYRQTGSGPALLLLSANPGDSLDYAAVMPQFARAFTVYALDWPGYGASSAYARPETATVASLYECFRQFLHALELDKVCIVGNSVGGNVAARFAAEHPQRVTGLVLVAPGGFTPQNLVTRLFCRWMGSRFALSPRRWASLYLHQQSGAVPTAMLQRAAAEQSQPAALQLNRALWRSFGRPENDLRAIAAAITAPCLLLFGRKDPAIAANKDGVIARQLLPAARFQVLPCGHASFAELPEPFLAATLPFLNQLAMGSS